MAAIIIPEENDFKFLIDKTRNILTGVGFSEVYNYSFIGSKDINEGDKKELIEIQNPISEDFKYLRPELTFNLLKNVKNNFRFFSARGACPSEAGRRRGPTSGWEYIKKILSLEQSRLKKLGEIGERVSYFFKIPKYEPELLVWRDMLFKDIIASLKVSLSAISQISNADFNQKNLEKILLKEAERAKNKDKGRLLWPLRVALTGLEASPGPFEILEILGKDESIKRIEAAIKNLA